MGARARWTSVGEVERSDEDGEVYAAAGGDGVGAGDGRGGKSWCSSRAQLVTGTYSRPMLKGKESSSRGVG